MLDVFALDSRLASLTQIIIHMDEERSWDLELFELAINTTIYTELPYEYVDAAAAAPAAATATVAATAAEVADTVAEARPRRRFDELIAELERDADDIQAAYDARCQDEDDSLSVRTEDVLETYMSRQEQGVENLDYAAMYNEAFKMLYTQQQEKLQQAAIFN